MHEWSDFFIAIAGAAAALTGLIFVGISISLEKILLMKGLPSRAFEALALLLTVLIVSALALVPRQTAFSFGIETICIGLLMWGITLSMDIGILRAIDKEFKKFYWLNLFLSQLSVIPYIISGIVMLSQGFIGIYWLVPGLLFSFIKAVIDSWVLLVEIRR